MRRSELAARFIARQELTPEQEAEAIRELGALLEQRERSLGGLDAGRSLAWEARRMWGRQVRANWIAAAREVLKAHPRWVDSRQRLSVEVCALCLSKGIIQKNGEPHNQGTVYNFLLTVSKAELLQGQELNPFQQIRPKP